MQRWWEDSFNQPGHMITTKLPKVTLNSVLVREFPAQSRPENSGLGHRVMSFA